MMLRFLIWMLIGGAIAKFLNVEQLEADLEQIEKDRLRYRAEDNVIYPERYAGKP